MSEPTNLNRARKERARAAKRAKGDENAFAYGRTKAEKQIAAARLKKAAQDLDGKKREE